MAEAASSTTQTPDREETPEFLAETGVKLDTGKKYRIRLKLGTFQYQMDVEYDPKEDAADREVELASVDGTYKQRLNVASKGTPSDEEGWLCLTFTGVPEGKRYCCTMFPGGDEPSYHLFDPQELELEPEETKGGAQ